MFAFQFNKRDLIAAMIVVFLAVLLILLPFLWQQTGEILVITTPDGNAEYRLSENQAVRLSSNGIDLTVRIENGEAWVDHSTCPDGICMAGGRLSASGDTVICAPAGVRLLVKGGDGEDVDFVAG